MKGTCFSPEDITGSRLGMKALGISGAVGDTDRDDLQLVRDAQRGNKDAYRQLVERYQQRAHSIALGILGNFADAEDAVQESFVKAFRNLSSFRMQSGFYTWLYRIVYNVCIDMSRKRYRSAETLLGDDRVVDSLAQSGAESNPYAGQVMGYVPGADAKLRESELQQRIQEALASLSPEQRAVIILREIEGLSYDEIRTSVGCSKGTVMSRLFHARKKLQVKLEDIYEETFGEVRQSSGDAIADESESSVMTQAIENR